MQQAMNEDIRDVPDEPSARRLAEWALSLKLSDVEPAVLEKVKLHILDQIGAQVSCRNLPTCAITREYVTKYGLAGPSAILGTNLRVDPEYAGLANGTSGSSFEIDDYGGKGANCHPGCAVVPGTFAVGEAVNASGAEVLRAATVGFELVIRLALATMPSLLLERGFHHTSTLGGFAVALGAAMLQGDDLDVTTNAIAIAGSHASGTTEFARSGGEVKRVHGGMGVAGGIRSERFARLGISGPPTIFEGPRGFLQAFCNGFDPKPLTEDLGERWHFYDMIAIKLYASCALMQAHFAAFDKIKAERRVNPDDIKEVILGCDPLTYVHTGNIGPHPKDVLGAQFSAEFGVAMRIVNGKNDVGAYLDLQKIGFQDRAIQSVAERTRLYQDPDFSFHDPKGSVTLVMRDGSKLSAEAYAPGSPGNPVVRSDYETKYRDLVSRDFGDDVAQRSLDLIMNLENVADLRQITSLFETSKA